MKICKKCGKEFSVYFRQDNVVHNLCSRKFCLECSPLFNHNTKDLCKIESNPDYKKCPICEQTLPIDNFYKKSGRDSTLSYCKKCSNNIAIKNQRKNKIKAIEYKGGKCQICSYSRCTAALEFHHTDPSKKEAINFKNRSFAKIKEEVDKCMLLCVNCHRETHSELMKL